LALSSQRLSPEHASNDGRSFAENAGMPEHSDLFAKAALVARDPDRFDFAELDDAERSALTYERDHKWHGPKMLWYSIALCAIGAATQGWDQTGSNGANLSFPQDFNIDPNADGISHQESLNRRWKVGLINAIIFLTAGLMWAIPDSFVRLMQVTDVLQWCLYRRSS
jgi:hypothetical protein